MLTLENLAELREKFKAALSVRVAEFTIGEKPFQFNSHPAIMGVVNLSGDSWYRESVCLSTDRAVERGRLLAVQGADLVDIGAESTLAKAARVGLTEQKSKLIPVIQGLHKAGVLVSVETYLPELAEECLRAGANVLNLTGTNFGESIFRTVAAADAAVILCYVQGSNVREVGELNLSCDPIEMMYDYFGRAVDLATRFGVSKILIDPGLGFYYRNLQDSAARVQFQMRTFLSTFRLRSLGFPVCHALPHAFEYFGEQLRSAEGLFAVLAALGKTDLFRTHEVPLVRAVLETLRAY